jgi:SAM-dependent methyltransferase
MQTYSILRREEDRVLGGLTLTGRVIDLGGHKGSSYMHVLTTEQPIEVANIDVFAPGTHKTPSGADHVFDFEKPFPLTDNSFNTILCVNVLEHIFDYENLLNESNRILAPGGHMYVTVPFFFNVHGSPNDYFRYTSAALKRLFEMRGFVDVHVTELGFGPLSAIFQNFGGSIPTMPLRLACMHATVWIDRVFSRLSKRYASIVRRVPLGYFLEAHKPR